MKTWRRCQVCGAPVRGMYTHPKCGGSRSSIKTRKANAPKSNNPPGYVLGRVVEIRYKRTTGKHRGQFKHTFKRGKGVLVAGYDKNGKKIILVKEK